jgi:8-oxo-dGTP diphosphatase
VEEFSTWLPVVAVALSDGQGRWLMHRRPEGKHHAGLWEFPGGKVESDENPVLALIREAREELGIELSREHLHPLAFADDAVLPEGQGIVILLYTAEAWQGQPQPLEGGAVAWFTLAELACLPKPPLDHELARALARFAAR